MHKLSTAVISNGLVAAMLAMLMNCHKKEGVAIQQDAQKIFQYKTIRGLVTVVFIGMATEPTALQHIRIALQHSPDITSDMVFSNPSPDKKSFWLINQKDSLPCVICERIPGVSSDNSTYMLGFGPVHTRDRVNTRLLIQDSIAGFGNKELTEL